MESWRARLGVLAGRGETTGPRVEEARAALSWWRRRASLMKTLDISEERAEWLMSIIAQNREADDHTDAGAVAR